MSDPKKNINMKRSHDCDDDAGPSTEKKPMTKQVAAVKPELNPDAKPLIPKPKKSSQNPDDR